MKTTRTLKATLAILSLLFLGHAFVVYKIHMAPPSYDFLDHRHQQQRVPKNSKRFHPIIVTADHLTGERYLPDALRYPLYTNVSASNKLNPTGSCCEMASLKGTVPTPQNIQCEGICLTKRACIDRIYPFTSEKEATFFKPKEWNSTNIPTLRATCRKMNHKLHPPFAWCRQWMVAQRNVDAILDVTNTLKTYSHTNIDPMHASLPPPGCSRTSEGGGSGPYQHLTLFPKAKLAFCGIPKISITQWLQFLRFTFGAKDYQAFPHAKPDVKLMRFDRLEEDSQKKILNDPEWKFAAFLRNPAERLLSAYLDKVNGGQRDKAHFSSNYGNMTTPTFEEFVRLIAKNRTDFELGSKTKEKLYGVDWLTDPHWRPQTYSCGMSEFLPRFSYIGSLDRIEDQARALLQKVGLWEDYGQFYHRAMNTKNVTRGICSLEPPKLNEGDKLFGFLQLPKEKEDENGNAYRHSHHSTGSQSKLDEYYTPELRSIVEEKLYRMDVKLWKLVEEEEDLVSGSDLASKISEKCKAISDELNGR